jgi:hypothetical protein
MAENIKTVVPFQSGVKFTGRDHLRFYNE